MDFLVDLSMWLADNIFDEPAFLVGLIALIGLLVQKKKAPQVVSGTLKTIVGFLIIQVGAGVIAGALEAFGPMWQEVFGMPEAAPPVVIGTDQFINTYGGTIALMMTFGFLINVLLARITPFKYIYLTGHMMFWVCFVYMGMLVEVFGEDVSRTAALISGMILMGIYWTLQPAYLQKYVRKITGRDDIAMGHTFSFGAWAGAKLGARYGNPEHSTEDIKVPPSLEFLKDSNVIIVAVMAALYLLGAIFAGADFMGQFAGEKNYIVFGLLQGIMLGTGIVVVLQGVRLFIGEIVPAFRGISTKIVPKAKPALDVPVIFPYAQSATIIGFAAAFVVSIVLMIILGVTGIYVFVPPMIALFFHAAGAGVFGNATGGIKGAIIAGAVVGVVITLGQALFVLWATPTTVSDFILWGGDTDMFIFGGILRLIMGIFGG